jgi:hypothetical protein
VPFTTSQLYGQFSIYLKTLYESKVIDLLMEKTVSVEAAAEGPRVKPKRQLTELQLAALKKGRERLAAKRQAALQTAEEPSEGAIAAAAAASEAQPPQEQPQVQPQDEQQQDTDSSSEEDYYYSGPCVVM